MTIQPSDVFQVLRDIQKTAEVLEAKAADALKLLSELNLPQRATADCTECGLKTRGPHSLAEHMYQVHDGPLPRHVAELDRRVLEPAAADDQPA